MRKKTRWSSPFAVCGLSVNMTLMRSTVKPRFTDTHLIGTPHYYEQFAVSVGKESPYRLHG